MLIRARKSFFNNNNIAILNNKVAITFPILNSNKQLLIVH